jgi:predicted metal-dependent phosphoesterase TrpH
MDSFLPRLLPLASFFDPAALPQLPSVKIVLIDFHTHTSASDGALDPGELVCRARDGGLRLLAITDHDTVAGYEAAAARDGEGDGGLRLIPGVELSCLWSAATVHVVGLGIDSGHPAMAGGLATMAAARRQRGEIIASRLAALGFPGALEGAREKAGASQLGRPHFAEWMVEEGHARDYRQAFDRYLGRGKPGDVKVCWPALAEAVGWIDASGGTAVIAHPLKYRFTGMKLRRLLVDFVAAGGRAIEVRCGYQSPDQVQHLRRLARDFGLSVSVGSDFHRDAPYGAPLGVDTSPFAGLPGVWEQWLDTPAHALDMTGRRDSQ